jgi:coenzyme F420-dependent glucose-6-phosphate dehydrogenase
MAAIGFTLSSEEFGPRELVGYGHRAEEVGFDFVSISDHFHPWVDRQGSSPFVWAVIGGLAEATERIAVTTRSSASIRRSSRRRRRRRP